ncbi:MAG TPA: DUF433 domain-containing protein [Actinomycetota bacterium]
MDVTVPEAAERTGLAAETIRRWIRAGKLPARKVGTQHLIDEDALDLVAGARPRRIVRERAPAYTDQVSAGSRRLLDRITVDPGILAGKPIVRGTRIAVELVLDCLAAGWSPQEFAEQYPHITIDDVRACIAFGAWRVRIEHVYPAPVI